MPDSSRYEPPRSSAPPGHPARGRSKSSITAGLLARRSSLPSGLPSALKHQWHYATATRCLQLRGQRRPLTGFPLKLSTLGLDSTVMAISSSPSRSHVNGWCFAKFSSEGLDSGSLGVRPWGYSGLPEFFHCQRQRSVERIPKRWPKQVPKRLAEIRRVWLPESAE